MLFKKRKYKKLRDKIEPILIKYPEIYRNFFGQFDLYHVKLKNIEPTYAGYDNESIYSQLKRDFSSFIADFIGTEVSKKADENYEKLKLLNADLQEIYINTYSLPIVNELKPLYNRELHNNIYQNFCLIFILFKDQVSIFINEAERDDHEAKMKIIKQEKAEKKTNREDEYEFLPNDIFDDIELIKTLYQLYKDLDFEKYQTNAYDLWKKYLDKRIDEFYSQDDNSEEEESIIETKLSEGDGDDEEEYYFDLINEGSQVTNGYDSSSEKFEHGFYCNILKLEYRFGGDSDTICFFPPFASFTKSNENFFVVNYPKKYNYFEFVNGVSNIESGQGEIEDICKSLSKFHFVEFNRFSKQEDGRIHTDWIIELEEAEKKYNPNDEIPKTKKLSTEKDLIQELGSIYGLLDSKEYKKMAFNLWRDFFLKKYDESEEKDGWEIGQEANSKMFDMYEVAFVSFFYKNKDSGDTGDHLDIGFPFKYTDNGKPALIYNFPFKYDQITAHSSGSFYQLDDVWGSLNEVCKSLTELEVIDFEKLSQKEKIKLFKPQRNDYD